MKEKLQSAYEAMNQVFTSAEFANMCRAHDVDEKVINTGGCADFLHSIKCVQLNGKGTKTWAKPGVNNEEKAQAGGINDAIEMLADFQRICNEHYFSFNLEWYKAAREHFSKYKHTL